MLFWDACNQATFQLQAPLGRLGDGMKTTWITDVLEGKYDGQKVELKGWVKRSRGSNKIRFVVLRDSTGSIQCVAKKDAIGEESFDALKSGKIDLYTLRNRASTKQIRDNMSESEKIAYDKKIYANLTEQQLVDKRKRQKKYYYETFKNK